MNVFVIDGTLLQALQLRNRYHAYYRNFTPCWMGLYCVFSERQVRHP